MVRIPENELEPIGTIPRVGDYVIDIGPNYDGNPVKVEKIEDGVVFVRFEHSDTLSNWFQVSYFTDEYGDLDYCNRVLKRKQDK